MAGNEDALGMERATAELPRLDIKNINGLYTLHPKSEAVLCLASYHISPSKPL